ncbi:DUF6881 domain-containing protein [Amycolatopsis sp. 3B14]|uniref:DUF6881 domain-containing protein n=1 Tax=Amycolatopsis sp. 3B14 TaxID=3243600 RepID=UPI003D9A05BF
MPSYKKVIWRHDYPDQPVLLYSETGDDGYEARKVDLYRDGRQDYADESTSIGTTFLAQEPEPPLEEIAAAPLISEAVPGSGAEPRDGCAPPPSWPLCPGESTRGTASYPGALMCIEEASARAVSAAGPGPQRAGWAENGSKAAPRSTGEPPQPG